MVDSHAVHQNWSFPVNTKWQYNVSRIPSLHRLKNIQILYVNYYASSG